MQDNAPRHQAEDPKGRRTRQIEPRDWDDTSWRGDRGRGDGWGDGRSGQKGMAPPGRPPSQTRRPSQAGRHDDERSARSRHEPRDWDDEGWRGEGWDDGRRGSRGQPSRDGWGDGSWSPPSGRGPSGRGQGVAARGAAAWRDASARFATVSKRSSRLPAWLDARLPKERRARMVALTLLVVILVCAVGSIPGSVFAYSSTMSLAKDGVAELKLAEADFKTLGTSPTNLHVINSAQGHLQRAHDDFARIQFLVTTLTPAQGLPKVGDKLGAAARLTPLAVEGTQAGILACDALKVLVTGLKNPLGTSGGLTSSDMSKISGDVDQVQSLFGQIGGQIQQLRPSDLTIDPRLGPLVGGVVQKLPEITQLVNDLDGFTHALPQLLGVGKPSTYLVLILDSSELRPTGGFIGNFGTLSIDSGRMDPNFHIRDITLLDSSVKFGDVPNQQIINIPAQYAWLKTIFKPGSTNSWSLRDSNLDPDYPTTARSAITLYSQLLPDAQKNIAASGSNLALYNPQASGQFAGVVTLSLGFFQQALSVTGKIQVQDGSINETITADNFVQKIHYYALAAPGTGPDNQVCGETSCAKVFTADVVKAFMTKVKSNLSQYLGGLAKLFYDSLRTKDIEVYLSDAKAQQMLSDLRIAAEVQAPATGDSVFEVESNIGANKDNYFLQYKMADQITVDQSGAATHHLNWQYTWPNDPATLAESFAAGSTNYHSYSRIYVPPSAAVISQSNLVAFGQDNPSAFTFNRRVFHGAAYAYSNLGQTYRYAVAWKAPGVVIHDSTGYHYHLMFQREAGIVWPMTLSITLPACAKLTGAPQTSGFTKDNTYTISGTTFTLTGPLTQDIQVQLDYTC